MGRWRDGIFGAVTGDALGCPVEFMTRTELAENPVTGMREYGTHDQPRGTWTDDSSMMLATLSSIIQKNGTDLFDIMDQFSKWLYEGKYSPFGEVFDIGIGTELSIRRYKKNHDVHTCGGAEENDNGNGSLMRILPVCLYCCAEEEKGKLSAGSSVLLIHQVSELTHRHIRSKTACGLYFFMVKAVLEAKKQSDLPAILQKGIDEGMAFYRRQTDAAAELFRFSRLYELDEFRKVPESEIRSSGYVVDTLEAAVWCLLTTTSFREALLKAVNLGSDTDTVAAVTGGLAGLYYRYEDIPKEWISALPRKEWIEKISEEAEDAFPLK